MNIIKKSIYLFVFLSFLLLAGCAAQGETALSITGNVANEKALTEKQVKDMDTMDVEYTNKDGEESVHAGVLIADLLNMAEPNTAATAVIFVADDGYSAEATLEEMMTCTDCIVSPQSEGGFNLVMPDFSGKLQVKGVIEIQVK